MMKLRVQLFGRLGTNLGSDIELEFPVEPTIREVIQILVKKDPILESMLLKNDNLNPGTILLINGHAINRSESGLDKILNTRDKVTLDRLGFLEIVGGG
ncbi:MAG: MoaD/ThiS family protein [Candidatus Hodarchaeota archaeon]